MASPAIAGFWDSKKKKRVRVEWGKKGENLDLRKLGHLDGKIKLEMVLSH